MSVARALQEVSVAPAREHPERAPFVAGAVHATCTTVDAVRVIGLPHELLGELVCACIVPIDGATAAAESRQDLAPRARTAAHVPDVARSVDVRPPERNGVTMRRSLEGGPTFVASPAAMT